MNLIVKNTVLAIAIVILVSLVAGCSSNFSTSAKGNSATSSSGASGQPTNGLVQSNSGGNVTVDVEWVKVEKGSLVFNVTLNTHSVDLDQYRLDELASLWDDKGKEYRPISWNSAPGGHHRSGTLVFPLPDSVSLGQADYVKMVIRDIAGVKEMVLRWEW